MMDTLVSRRRMLVMEYSAQDQELKKRATEILSARGEKCAQPSIGGCLYQLNLNGTSDQEFHIKLEDAVSARNMEMRQITLNKWEELVDNSIFTHYPWIDLGRGTWFYLQMKSIALYVGDSPNQPYCPRLTKPGESTACYWPFYDDTLMHKYAKDLLRDASIFFDAEITL